MIFTVKQLLDRQAITRVLYSAARASDRGDVALMYACRHPGATERHGDFRGAFADFIAHHGLSRPRTSGTVLSMFHSVSNVVVDFDGPDAAIVESYHAALGRLRTDSGIVDVFSAGRYIDRFERRDGIWAIANRDVVFEASRIDPETDKPWEDLPGTLHGARGGADPLYAYIPPQKRPSERE